MDESIKLGNLGVLVDAALAKHRVTFAQQAAFIGLINGIFVVVSFVFGWLALAVIWPAIPNFTGNQIITDGIILGVFSIPTLLLIAFFMAWQSAASIVICGHHGYEGVELPTVIKAVGRAAMPAAGVLFAQILVFVPFLAVCALVLAFNLAAIQALAPPLLIVLFIILVALRTLSFFSANLALDGRHRFLSALINSAKMVMQRGPIRIFGVTALITSINLGLFIGLFFAFLTIFGQIPNGIVEFLEILDNPMGVVALLFLAYIVTIFFTPKIQILAYTLYHYAEVVKEHDKPGLASRSLAGAMDIAIVAIMFTASFYAAAALVSGGSFTVSQMNVFAIIIVIIAFFAVYTIYNVYFEAFGGGQTLAKRAFGLIVRGQANATIGVMQSFVRNILRIADIFGFVAIVYNRDHRRLGDLLSLAIVEYKNEGDADVSG